MNSGPKWNLFSKNSTMNVFCRNLLMIAYQEIYQCEKGYRRREFLFIENFSPLTVIMYVFMPQAIKTNYYKKYKFVQFVLFTVTHFYCSLVQFKVYHTKI